MRRIMVVVGLILLLLGLVGLLFVQRQTAMATEQDQTMLLTRPVGPGCERPFRNAYLAERVMSERQTQTVTAVLANQSGTADCETTVALIAPGFDIAPGSQRPILLPISGETVVVSWIIASQEPGSYELLLIAGNEQRTLGVTVTDILGFTAAQAQILSYLSTFLGPMLTAPWWYEQWQKRQEAQAEKEKEQPTTSSRIDYRPE